MGSPDYGMDVCHTDFLPRNYFAAGVQIRPEHQPAVSLSEKYADVHSGRDISRAICIRSVLWYRAGHAVDWGTDIQNKAGPFRAVFIRCWYDEQENYDRGLRRDHAVPLEQRQDPVLKGICDNGTAWKTSVQQVYRSGAYFF